MLEGISSSIRLAHITNSCRYGKTGNGFGKVLFIKLQLTSIATRFVQLPKGTAPDNSLSASSREGLQIVPGMAPVKEFALRSSTDMLLAFAREDGRVPTCPVK